MEREQYQREIRDLQDQLSEMHDELDGAKRVQAASAEKEEVILLIHTRNKWLQPFVSFLPRDF